MKRHSTPIRLLMWAVLCLMGISVGYQAARAAMPDAGTKIVNQGTVFFKDENGESRHTTTNIVTLTVQQVYSASLEGDGSAYSVPGGEAAFFHTLTNLGNGKDSYCITVEEAGGDSGDFDRLQVVVDDNHNGVADTGEEVLHLSGQAGYGLLTLERDQYAHLLVLGKTPGTAVDSNTFGALLRVRAQEGTGACQVGQVDDIGANGDATNDTNQDTVTVTNNAVLAITKSSVYQANGPGTNDDTIRYTVRIENEGALAAKDVVVTDALPNSTSYVAFSLSANGDWVGAGGDDGYNGQDGAEPTHDGGTPGTISGEVDLLAAGDTVDFSYTVDLDNSLVGGVLIENTARVQGELNDNPVTTEPSVDSNTTKDVFPVLFMVDITDTGVGINAGVNDGGDDDPDNDSQLVDEVAQGETVLFSNIVTNQGNSGDTINLEVTASTFPANTEFVFYNATGTVRLLDTNGDGAVDTGPMDAGGVFNIMVKAVLAPQDLGGGPYSATVTASSSEDPSGVPASDTVGEALTAVIAHLVDLANSNAALGLNDGGVVDADALPAVITSLSAVPGNTVLFTLYAANEGDLQDDYELTAWANAAGDVALSGDIQVDFILPSGKKITHTGPLDSGVVFEYLARVTSTEDAALGTVPIYFRAKSLVTLAENIKADALVVAIDESLALSPDQRSVISPGSVVHYVHLLQNTGNTAENVKVFVESQSHLRSELEFAVSFSGSEVDDWATVHSLNIGDNVIVFDPDTLSWKSVALVDDGSGGMAIPMDPGDFTRVRVRVQATLNEVEFTRDILILKAEVAVGTASAITTDITTVTQSQLVITKSGAVDTDCDNTADTAFGTGTLQALPGECVIWRLTATNEGNEPICDVTIHDGAAAFTQLSGGPGVPTIILEPAPGEGACVVTGQEFECTVGNDYNIDGAGGDEFFCLMPGQQATIQFRVVVE